MVRVTMPKREAAIVDVAVLLLTAIVVVGAVRSAPGSVYIEVAVTTPVPADESFRAGAIGAVDLLVHAHSPTVDPLAGRILDRTGAIERRDVRRVAGVGRI
jgi:hypothetical protein